MDIQHKKTAEEFIAGIKEDGTFKDTPEAKDEEMALSRIAAVLGDHLGLSEEEEQGLKGDFIAAALVAAYRFGQYMESREHE